MKKLPGGIKINNYLMYIMNKPEQNPEYLCVNYCLGMLSQLCDDYFLKYLKIVIYNSVKLNDLDLLCFHRAG